MTPRRTLAVGNFLSGWHFYLIVYIITPYLATFMPEEYTGLAVSAGALGTLALLPYAPRIVRRIGARRLLLVFTLVEFFTLLTLAFEPILVLAVVLIALACAISPLIAYCLDLLLEATVQIEDFTGRVRTAFLTAGNFALLIAPLFLSIILDSTNDYARIFIAAALSLLPVFALFWLQSIPEGKVPELVRTRESLRIGFTDPDIRSIFVAYYLLQFFYYSAPLYVPLYLHTVLGIPWTTLGWVLAVVLIPFVVIEYPAGLAADRWLGDKELMVAGFFIGGLGVVLFAWVTPATPLLAIIALLAATRVGIGLMEAMTEGHFFRRVSERDASMVSVFRMGRPFAALTAPIACSVLLALGGYWWLFMGCGLIVLVLGVISALGIRDVR
ncbi:MAG TPA: MFS transporter [Candidatus Paceibacterota bacterium]|nr:MFS transporter [Candidatus Paceibacterota bacterium]